MAPPGPDESLARPASVPSEPPLAGEHGRESFDTGAVVGAGGNATVYEAVPSRDPDRVVAVKEPHAAGTDDAGGTAPDRFEAEAETWASIDGHDHVVTVHAWGTDPHPWIGLEYVGGGTLADLVGDCGVARCLWTGACVAAALDHAHRAGVAHLDVTPGNVLLAETGADAWAAPKVADWGLAALLRAETVAVEGLSPRYAAPEQFAPDRFGPVGAATDVYQLGAVLYELLVGTAPFDGPPRALRDAVLEEPPPPASGRNTVLSPAVDDLLDRALAKEPADRYDSAFAFRRAIERVLADRVGADPDGTLAGARDADLAASPPGDAPELAPPEGAGGPGRDAPYERALALADEGFERLSDGYFARRDPAPPLAAWRRGVTLADARAGRAVERTVPDDDGAGRSPLADRLLDGLAGGTDHVVLGPPGSGKSTVCKQVACEWFDRGRGPVFYRESGRGERFERPDALARRVSDADGQALVVVEDAVRPEVSAVFDLCDRVAGSDDVAVLLDARESEWHEAGHAATPFGADTVAWGRDDLDRVHVPRPDGREYERFVRAVEAETDRPVDLDVEAVRENARRAAATEASGDRGRPGELFYLLHRLAALARDPLAGADAPTTLTEAVADAYDHLADLGDAALDVGVCANVCNAAGVGVHPALLHAVVPDDPLAVEDATDVLVGRALFPRQADWSDGTTASPAIHEAWSTAFLAHCLASGDDDGPARRFGRVVTRVLSLADDPELRARVSGALAGDAPIVDRIEAAPSEWADETAEAVHALGRERPKLAPLFGDGRDDSVVLPDSCSERILARRPVWLGRMFLAAGALDRAERAFERLPGPGAVGPLEGAPPDRGTVREQSPTESERAVERLLGLARVATSGGDYDAAEAYAERCLALVADADRPALRARARRQLGRALSETGAYDEAIDQLRSALDAFEAAGDRRRAADSLTSLGIATRRRGEYDRASDYFERSLAIYRDLGDRHGLADTLNSLGNVASRRSEYDEARDAFQRSLEIHRELGDRQGVAACLANLGNVARHRADYDRAREYHERCLEIDRQLGDRQGETVSLANLGNVAYRRGAYDRAREFHQQSRDIARDIGDRRGEEHALNNLAMVAVRQGDYEAARDFAEGGLDVARSLGDRHGVAIGLGHLGKLARLQGRYDRARERYERSLDLTLDLGFREGEADSRNNLGTLACRRGDHTRAREHLEAALAVARDVDNPVQTAKSQVLLGRVARREGEYGAAREALERALAAVGDDGDRFDAARVRLARGRLALARGDLDRARERAATARETFASLGATHWAGRGRLVLGRVAAAADEPASAREHWWAALASFEDVGAPQDALATLACLVERLDEAGDEDWAGECRARARDVLAGAPDPVADRHREWVRRGRAPLDEG